MFISGNLLGNAPGSKGSGEINSDRNELSSCSHVAPTPEGAVRISITVAEGSAKQIVDDFVTSEAARAVLTIHRAVLAF